MKRFFSFLKWIVIVSILFVGHAYLTDNSHIFKTLNSTVLQGRLGPPVDTKKMFATRKVSVGKPQPWKLDSMFGRRRLDETFYTSFKKYQTLAFLVAHNGKLVHEEYWSGYSSNSSTNSWSVAKSIVSILIGAAIKDGKIKSVDQQVSDFLPEFKGTGLKIKHLLTMSSGINFKENYINPYGYAAKALYGTNLKKLNRKYRMNNLPGKHFIYLSGNTQLLGFILQKATGKTLSAYASEALWKKIGAVRPALWSLDIPNGNEKSFCCFHSNARDFAKIGQLMLQKGIWNGDTIIPQDYYKASITPATAVLDNGQPNQLYGYQWWTLNYNGLSIYYARGVDGQYIINIPAKQVVIVRLGRKRHETKRNGHPEDVYTYIDAALSMVK